MSAGPADQPPPASGAPGPSSAAQGGQRGASVQTLARLLMMGCRERAFYLGKRAFLDTEQGRSQLAKRARGRGPLPTPRPRPRPTGSLSSVAAIMNFDGRPLKSNVAHVATAVFVFRQMRRARRQFGVTVPSPQQMPAPAAAAAGLGG
uniref:Uncharacterized protein n=1 Tax=Emiliania huxleyi TaxID=2903 RepID=A0A7S3SD95_EMIHU